MGEWGRLIASAAARAKYEQDPTPCQIPPGSKRQRRSIDGSVNRLRVLGTHVEGNTYQMLVVVSTRSELLLGYARRGYLVSDEKCYGIGCCGRAVGLFLFVWIESRA